MELYAAVITGPGKIRPVNQDNFYLNGTWRTDPADRNVLRGKSRCTGEGLYAVADGIGGGMHGELASLMSVSMLKDVRGDLCGALMKCSDAIAAEARKRGGIMGSAFALIQIRGKQAVIYNIGDSRVYLFRGGVLEQLSRDHTGTSILVELGFLTREQARSHPDGHVLTQYLGYDRDEMRIEPFVCDAEVRGGDSILLCSDGLSDMLTDGQIASVMKQSLPPEETVERLYAMAMEEGGRDNITALLIRTEEETI